MSVCSLPNSPAWCLPVLPGSGAKSDPKGKRENAGRMIFDKDLCGRAQVMSFKADKGGRENGPSFPRGLTGSCSGGDQREGGTTS